DFRNFFKPQDALVYNINTSIEDTLKLVNSIYEKEKIVIYTEYEENLLTLGYPNEINQVIINILNNARDIILEKNSDVKTVLIKTYKESDNLLSITITDCAGGVPEDIIDKVFDPYITTKSEDKGTGIGLDMSKTIVEKVDGSISVENIITKIEDKEYLGASFKITLPLSKEKAKEEIKED
ncbi:MAG: HAMP domain-containing sensor histidine kinase, partial [Campylobacterota bacterium]|nr:HAMP domain-containing sensor histidine kinase [Campylobacterota bacterium]